MQGSTVLLVRSDDGAESTLAGPFTGLADGGLQVRAASLDDALAILAEGETDVIAAEAAGDGDLMERINVLRQHVTRTPVMGPLPSFYRSLSWVKASNARARFRTRGFLQSIEDIGPAA